MRFLVGGEINGSVQSVGGGGSVGEGRGNSPLHAALEVVFAQLAAFVVVDAAVQFDAFEVALHDGLAFGFVI
jgi:hypothetical protein